MTAVARIMDEPVSATFASPAYAAFAVPLEAPQDFAAPFAADAALPCDAERLIQGIRAELRQRIGVERFDLWFDHKTRITLAGNTLLIEAVNDFFAHHIRTRFTADLRTASAAVMRRELDISVRAGAPLPAEVAIPPAAASSAAHHAPASRPALPSLINSKYTLEEFVVGPSNQLAFHAACRVAENPGKEFNPLFLHGHCGLGKSHLLQGICQRFSRLHPTKKWLYLTGEQFTNEFLDALKTHKTDAFRRRIRNADLLVLDDVHFLANKKATQEEFLHTFNQIDGHGKQVVLASDCAPRQIQSLSEHLSTRFVSGMVLRVDSPDLPTRLEILRRRAMRNSWNISDTVLMHIARSSVSSVRELEGLLLQAVAGISLINSGQAKAADTEALLANLRDRTAMRGPIPIDRIVNAAADHFAISPAAILGRGREKIVSLARAVAMYLARQHTGMSFPEIGQALGHKNHSSVIAACQRIEAMLTTGDLACWNTPTGPRHQSIPDALHDLECAIRRQQNPQRQQG